MKITAFILIISAAYLLSFCNSADKRNTKEQALPKALKDKKFELSSSRTAGNLVEELYQEEADKNMELRKFENEFSSYADQREELFHTHNDYMNNSQRYYTSAKDLAGNINDSLLRQKIRNLITDHKNLFEKLTSKQSSLSETIKNNERAIQDNYAALKIIRTLPLIRKYQEGSLPDTAQYRKIIDLQQKQIEMLLKLQAGK